MQIGEKEYLTYITGKDLVEFWIDKKIGYNPRIQRGVKLKVNRDEEIKVPVFSLANVKKIRDKILMGNYFTDMITLNLLENGEEYFEYKNGDLIIYEGETDLADGQHRTRALHMIKMSNDLKDTSFDLSKIIFPLKITHYDEKTAQQQFHQFSLGLKISRSRSEYFNATDYSNIVVRELMNNSDLADRVEIVSNSISKKDTKHIVTFATLVNAIEETYKIGTKKQAKELAKYLCQFFDELIDEIDELHDYDKRIESKETSFIGENFMFYGYVSISKILKGMENWKEKILLIKELDLFKGSKIWFGQVTKHTGGKVNNANHGFGIINNKQSRNYMINKAAEEFERALTTEQLFVKNEIAADKE
ncbi:hypothetical protein HYG84_18260 (plasmid) [Alkaliphilus sp. B6464]|nr:hypothetical protein HYG84_18260 [Alkaliphilus sp. B6464]